MTMRYINRYYLSIYLSIYHVAALTAGMKRDRLRIAISAYPTCILRPR